MYRLYYTWLVTLWSLIMDRTAEERILDAGYEDIIIFGNHGSGDSYDTALIGISEDGRAIYDFDLMVEWLMEQDDIDSTSVLNGSNIIQFVRYLMSEKSTNCYV